MRKATYLWRALVLAALVVLAASTVAQGDAPPWHGQDGTTYQKWTFDTADNPADPSSVSNPYGDPTASIVVGDLGSGWQPEIPFDKTLQDLLEYWRAQLEPTAWRQRKIHD